MKNNHEAPQPHMDVDEVLNIVFMFEKNDIVAFIDGGWGVDALIGKQTRPHSDLDIAVQHKDVPKLRNMLSSIGYNEIPRDDTRECNFVLADEKSHQIDVHSYTFDDAGNITFGVPYPRDSLTGVGTIQGRSVNCISPEWMVKFHTGYPLDEDDYHDVSLLCKTFNIPLPTEYDAFINKKKMSS